MPGLDQWTRLQCPMCSSDQFVKMYHIVSRHGAGTTESPIGWECGACHKHVDMGQMQEQAELRQMEEDIKQRREMMRQRERPADAPQPTPAS